jgi:hypothetical protein
MVLTSMNLFSEDETYSAVERYGKPLLFGGFVRKILTTQPPPYHDYNHLHLFKQPCDQHTQAR